MDVTDHPNLGELNAERQRMKPRPESFQPASVNEVSKIKELISSLDLNDTHLREDIAKLTSFWNRSYKSPWGLLSSEWVYGKVWHVGHLHRFCPNSDSENPDHPS